MSTTTNLKHKANVRITVEEELENIYPEITNFYTDIPAYSISIIQFEEYAMERLKMLCLLEKIKSESATYNTNEHFNAILRAINKHKKDVQTYHALFSLDFTAEPGIAMMARKIDHIAHFLLRLVFARNDQGSRQWFMTLETDLFRLKLYKLSNLNTIIQKHGLPYDLVNEHEKNRFRRQISNASFLLGPSSTFDCPIYKTSFNHASDLIRKRKVFIHKGYAYIPLPDLAGIISLKFRNYLSESLSILEKNWHVVKNDERVLQLVNGIRNHHITNDTGILKSGIAVSAAELATLADTSFPLCMKHLYDVVIKDHHIKHWGRLQLGLFFKGIGLPLQEAMHFWRHNFTKRKDIDINRFDRQYSYHVRHMYGQEGKRTDYTPYCCTRIINSIIGTGDHHGCPFKHNDNEFLNKKIIDAGISQKDMKEIQEFVVKKKYQLACLRYFELTHQNRSIDGGINHPNQYFIESQNSFIESKKIEQEGHAKPTNTNGGSRTLNIGFDERQSYENITDEFRTDEPDEVLASMEKEKF